MRRVILQMSVALDGSVAARTGDNAWDLQPSSTPRYARGNSDRCATPTHTSLAV